VAGRNSVDAGWRLVQLARTERDAGRPSSKPRHRSDAAGPLRGSRGAPGAFDPPAGGALGSGSHRSGVHARRVG
jgi:hypothetical protein